MQRLNYCLRQKHASSKLHHQIILATRVRLKTHAILATRVRLKIHAILATRVIHVLRKVLVIQKAVLYQDWHQPIHAIHVRLKIHAIHVPLKTHAIHVARLILATRVVQVPLLNYLEPKPQPLTTA